MRTIYTIGYEGTDIDRFVGTLKAVGIDAIADVRAVPHSRKKGFSKNAFAQRLEAVGVGYIPMQELGDPKAGREAARAGNYDAFRQIYNAHIDLPEVAEAVRRLATGYEDKVLCLLCFERDPVTCHRYIVGERMAAFGYDMFHLYGDDPDKYLRNRSKLPTASHATL